MTEHEQSQEVGRVVLAHAAAKKKVACLESKAETVASDLKLLAEVLTVGRRTVSETSFGFNVASSTENLVQISVPSKDDLAKLFKELAEARSELQALAKRRSSFGIDS